jgi:hypothetical protein
VEIKIKTSKGGELLVLSVVRTLQTVSIILAALKNATIIIGVTDDHRAEK